MPQEMRRGPLKRCGVRDEAESGALHANRADKRGVARPLHIRLRLMETCSLLFADAKRIKTLERVKRGTNGGMETMSSSERKVNWWLTLAGVVLVVCGIAIFAAPAFFLEFLTVWAGIGFLVSGAAGIVSYVQVRRHMGNAGFHVFMALLDIVVGIVLIVHPYAFAELIPWLLGAAFIAFGVMEIVGLMPFTHLIPETRTIAIISGVLSVLVGIMFLVWPASLSIWVAAFALVRGITLIAVGFISR